MIASDGVGAKNAERRRAFSELLFSVIEALPALTVCCSNGVITTVLASPVGALFLWALDVCSLLLFCCWNKRLSKILLSGTR